MALYQIGCDALLGSAISRSGITKIGLPLPSDVSLVSIDCSNMSTAFAVTSQHEIWAWGSRLVEVGDGGDPEVESVKPFRVRLKEECTAVQIAATERSVFIVTTIGAAYEWTLGEEMMTGFPSLRAIDFPTKCCVVQVSVGRGHVLMRDERGIVFGCGNGTRGQLGPEALCQGGVAMVQIHLPEDSSVSWIACGAEHSAVVTSSGAVYTFGANQHDQLGIRAADATPGEICRVETFGQGDPGSHPRKAFAVRAALGAWHTLVLTEGGHVYSFGWDKHGQLGLGSCGGASQPTFVEALDCVPIKDIACGSRHSVALSESGDLYQWGWNGNGQVTGARGQFGDADVIDIPELVDDTALPDTVAHIYAGAWCTIAVQEGLE